MKPHQPLAKEVDSSSSDIQEPDQQGSVREQIAPRAGLSTHGFHSLPPLFPVEAHGAIPDPCNLCVCVRWLLRKQQKNLVQNVPRHDTAL